MGGAIPANKLGTVTSGPDQGALEYFRVGLRRRRNAGVRRKNIDKE
jgi:hypothetical protein